MMAMEAKEAAVRQFQAGIACSDDPLSIRSLAMVYYATPDSLPRALELLRRYVARAPATLETRLARGILAYHEKRPSEAAVLWANYLLDRPESAQGRRFCSFLAGNAPTRCDSMMLQVSVHFALGEMSDGAYLTSALAQECGDEPGVLEFVRAVLARYLPQSAHEREGAPNSIGSP